MSFDAVKAALERGRLAHALLFLGAPGSGQLEAARELAKALFCMQKKKVTGCGECASCKLVDAGNHPDFRVFEPKDDARSMKVEEVRQMLTEANFKPFQASSKVFVIDHADTLSDVSQNTLLKTLEEPPGHMYFVLISYAAEKMLSTVRSRAQELRFTGETEEAEEDPKKEQAEQAVLDFLTGKRVPELGLTKREEVLPVLDGVIRELRGALLANVGAGKGSGRPGIAEITERLSPDEIIAKIEKLAEFKEKMEQNVNVKLALSVLWEEL